MEHIVCLNSNSFPAANPDEAYLLFKNSLNGLFQLSSGKDKYQLYHDSNSSQSLDNFELSQNFSYKDFKEKLYRENDIDLYMVLDQIDDKSPALDYLSDDNIEEISTYSFYLPEYVNTPDNGIFGIAWFLNAIMLSIPTHDIWNSHIISIARVTDDGQYINEKLTLRNISCLEHGKLIYQEFAKLGQINIDDVCNNCKLTDDFKTWYEKQSSENRQRIIEKLKLSCERNFNGGVPLFKTLKDEEGLREIRILAYPGGAIRILFKALGNSKQAILVGFIKKNDNEGYSTNISRANKLFERLMS